MTEQKMSLLEIAEKQRQIDVSKPSRAKSKLAIKYLKTYTTHRLLLHGLTPESGPYKTAYAQVVAHENDTDEEHPNGLTVFARAKMAFMQGVTP